MPVKRIIIMGATSGIGAEVARLYIEAGHVVGLAGRRFDCLTALQALAPERVHVKSIDINAADAPERLLQLIDECGGMDLYLHSSGIGHNNPLLDPVAELDTVTTNALGFTRAMTMAFNFFIRQGYGHLAAITSIAGTRGLGSAPAYSATKRFQTTYLSALAQQACFRHCRLAITDIRPGFVRTPFIEGGRYPLQMDVHPVARAICRALRRRRRSLVIDWRYALLVALWRLIPRWLWERLPVIAK